jgi:hypothetical protein
MACDFIGHSNRDHQQGGKLLEWLHGQGFADTFLDFDKHGGIPPGADWERTLYRELTRSEAVLSVLTKNWFESNTLLLVLHDSWFKYLRSFYNGVVGDVLRRYFPGMPCNERFITLQQNASIPLLGFPCSRLGHGTGSYFSSPLAASIKTRYQG